MKILIPDRVLTQEFDEEIVLLNIQSEQYFSLDEVGSLIWMTLSATGSVEMTFQQLQTLYSVEASRLRADLVELVEQLAKNGLVEILEG